MWFSFQTFCVCDKALFFYEQFFGVWGFFHLSGRIHPFFTVACLFLPGFHNYTILLSISQTIICLGELPINLPRLKQIYMESQFLFLFFPHNFFLSFTPVMRNKGSNVPFLEVPLCLFYKSPGFPSLVDQILNRTS